MVTVAGWAAQAIKRLLTFMQRCFPTDPSRSVDFDGHRDAAYGAAGGGSDKLVRPSRCQSLVAQVHSCVQSASLDQVCFWSLGSGRGRRASEFAVHQQQDGRTFSRWPGARCAVRRDAPSDAR